MKRNALVAQSGGPSPVINASLHGVIEACLDRHGEIGSIYAPRHGIEGVLQEELIDVGAQDRHEIALLRATPAAGVIGTCRYKLKEEQTEDLQRIIDVFRAHDIGFFFSIGGNDSMDTAAKVAGLAKAEGHDLIAVGVPKTIDNDLGDEARPIIDHTPGYGSCARYWAYLIQNVNGENRGMCVSEPAAANSVRHLPAEWIASDKLDVTDALIDYARPLIGDEPPELAIEGGDQCVGLLVLRVGLHGEPRDR